MPDLSDDRLVVKIVYYGPALSGKTTNLMQLHDMSSCRLRGDLLTFETKGDRTLFFDLLPLLVTSERGFKIKIKLFTVPGQVAHDATRKAVLSRADGVVFVADSQSDQAMSNFESFDNLEKNIARVGLDVERLPLIIQFNKRDMTNILPEDDILERWQCTGLPITFSSALYGEGVQETFVAILRATYRYLDLQCQLKARYQVDEQHFLAAAPQLNPTRGAKRW